MKVGGRRCLVCDCEGTMPLDGAALAAALGSGAGSPRVHRQLCRAELDAVREAAAGGEGILVACEQEAPLFAGTLAELGAPAGTFVDIRDRAGWSEEGGEALAKMAALLAESAVERPPAAGLELRSEGRCLVVGAGEAALEAARRLAPRLDVTLLLTGGWDGPVPPRVDLFPILRGRLRRASGHLGAFRAAVEGLARAHPSSREGLRFGRPQDGEVELAADLLLDLTGGTAWFPAPEKRDGYLRADPNHPLAVERALFAATELVGQFEKPRYVAYTAELCAHSRSRRTGCTRCLEQCPTGAIAPAGDHVAIDPYVCAGCGACAGVCPTGAASYAAPTANVLLERLRTLLDAYRGAGGTAPVLLVHEQGHGADLIGALARLGPGLPARALPFAVGEVAQLGFEFLAAAPAYGAEDVVVLAPERKRGELGGLEATVDQVGALLKGLGYGDRLRLLLADDPDALAGTLADLPRRAPVEPAAFLPMGGKRTLLRSAVDALHRAAPAPVGAVALPAGAPFGTLAVDVEGCTLCLACVGACPTGALLDNPDKPMLRFLEDACVQCGLCANTCPERVIRLEPRMSFEPEAKSPRVVKEEEPALCVRCGKAFGTRSSIERVVKKLAGRSWMFQTEDRVELMRMCDDCRVRSQLEAPANPFAAGERPRTRTSEDYLQERAAGTASSGGNGSA